MINFATTETMKKLSEETQAFIRLHAQDNIKSLALQEAKYPNVDMREAITQISGRQASASKIPSWQAVDGLLYPRHLSMEQCSSEGTARYKSSLASGNSFTDLTGGFGVDCALLASRLKASHYV